LRYPLISLLLPCPVWVARVITVLLWADSMPLQGDGRGRGGAKVRAYEEILKSVDMWKMDEARVNELD
jgi:hypothetical protein